MLHNVILFVSLLLVAILACVALVLAWPKTPVDTCDETPEETPPDPPAETPALQAEEHPINVIKETELANGDFELLVDWGPDSFPAAYRGPTREAAMKMAQEAGAAKRAMRGMREDY